MIAGDWSLETTKPTPSVFFVYSIIHDPGKRLKVKKLVSDSSTLSLGAPRVKG